MFYLALIFYPMKEFILFNLGYINQPPDISVGNIIGTITFLINELNPHWINYPVPGGWSITVEMTFYLFVPILFKIITSLNKALLITSIAYLISIIANFSIKFLNIFPIDAYGKAYLFYWFPNQLFIFCLGIMLYFVYSQKSSMEKYSRKILLFGSILLMFILTQIKIDTDYLQVHFLFGILFLVFAYALYLEPLHILVNRVTIFIGKISFSMYLTHFIVLQTVDLIVNLEIIKPLSGVYNFFYLYLLTLVITIAVSKLTYQYVELKGIDFSNKIIYRRNENNSVHDSHYNSV